MGEQRRKYPRKYKLEAVRRLVEGNEPVSQIARALGIRAEMLHSWVRQFKAEAVGGQGVTESDPSSVAADEIRALLADLRSVL